MADMEEDIIVEIDEAAVKNELRRRRRKRLLIAMSISSAFSCGLLIGIHWRVTKALVKGEELPEPPKWHRCFCHKK